jgi:hypothetical protein
MELIKTTTKEGFLSKLSELKGSGRVFSKETLSVCKPKGYNYFVVHDTHFFLVTKKEYQYLLNK